MKEVYLKRVQYQKLFFWYTNMAAVPLFVNHNMATLTLRVNDHANFKIMNFQLQNFQL